MAPHRITVLAFCLLVAGIIFHPMQAQTVTVEAPADTVAVTYLQVYDQLMYLRIDPVQVAPVHNLTLRRDVGIFELREGTLYLCSPVEGHICAALFQGRGHFRFTPPTRIEREHLFRFYEVETFEQDFTTLFLIFADSTLQELRRKLTFASGEVPREAQEAVAYALKYLGNKKGHRFNYSIAKTFLERDRNNLFYAHFSKRKIEPFFFMINPFAYEPVRFMRRRKGGSFLHDHEIINQFHLQAAYRGDSTAVPPPRMGLFIHHYDIDCTLRGHALNFSARTRVAVESLWEGQKSLEFWLYKDLVVDSVFWEDGRPARFFKEKHNPTLWIQADHPLKRGEKRVLTLYYHGDLLERRRDWFLIKSSKGWYPRHGARQKATFEVTYHYPEGLRFASFGKNVLETSDGKISTSRWIADTPIRNASFNIGFFEDLRLPAQDSLPAITVYMADFGHRGIGPDMKKDVGADIRNSIRFFTRIFGPAVGEHVYATEIPFGHGEAFPGMIHLSWKTFDFANTDGENETFRAHEVAHQWWGIGVDIRSYHDLWISEGFAEYAGWWYFQEVLQQRERNDRKFYRWLRDWRKRIIGNRKYFLGEGQKAAPIWLGYRTYSSDTKEDYTLIIYKKGAWVLHMLRTLLLDLNTMSDARFRALMKGFYQAYAGKYASTEDFIRYAEQATGEELDWFFDQWVYGASAPRYRCAHQVVRSAPGRYKILVRIKQENVSPDFRMPMIVGVRFEGEENPVPYRVWIEGELTEVSLGPFDRKPRKVIWNYLESVLCDIKREQWKPEWTSHFDIHDVRRAID